LKQLYRPNFLNSPPIAIDHNRREAKLVILTTIENAVCRWNNKGIVLKTIGRTTKAGIMQGRLVKEMYR
jgi:hypothetical protein